MLRIKLEIRTSDLKLFRVRPVPTWYRDLNLMAMERARERRPVPILLLLSKRMKKEGDGSFMCNSTDIGQRSVHIAKEERLHRSTIL